MTSSAADLGVLNGQKYLNLETYRKDGKAVRTPVWFAVSSDSDGPTLYVYTLSDSGKAKRIRRSGTARIAPCNARGTVTGAWLDAHAEIVGGQAFDRGMQLLNRKYRPWKQILDLSVLLRRQHQRIMLAIRPM